MTSRAIAICLLLSLVAILAYLVGRDQGLKSRFAAIDHGAPRSKVLEALGQPHALVKCGTYGGMPPPECVQELTFVSVMPSSGVWVVSLDGEDRVVGKLRYRSP
jgi:hypothetical protein